jgi:hypothetical protein
METGEPSESEVTTTTEAAQVPTPWTGPFKFRKHYVGATTFVVSAHGTVSIAAHATWDRPASCKLPTFTIELVKAGLFGSKGARTYPTSGTTTTQKWTDLGVGTYHLVFDSTNDTAECQLLGGVTVNVTP